MGETREEVSQALVDLHAAGCELITITQYLRPSARHHPVERWVKPEEFVELKDEADEIGFFGVMSGPLVRSSYRAGRALPAGDGEEGRGVNDAFGTRTVDVVFAAGLRAPEVEMELVRDRLAALGRGGGAELNIAQPMPTAAFSWRDALLPGYGRAETAVSLHGFTRIIRSVGGHLAVYDEGALVLHLWAPHPAPGTHIRTRFELFGDANAKALTGLGVDARVGAVPGEYCDGEFSVNDSGRVKPAGAGQRITRAGYSSAPS